MPLKSIVLRLAGAPPTAAEEEEEEFVAHRFKLDIAMPEDASDASYL
jgi:hypothetical protein